ncbi:hypothetical protein TeGR_g2861 [Tetraparma gracilis]|uniref:START domain-containing protein n=1 Tax=Tetraparma gracilis TaxID=2962635 RepID=A0ABQ6MYC4_9STRA|nr:hypothetical protein TeGR_g2861 [Tetraparma gracilis]
MELARVSRGKPEPDVKVEGAWGKATANIDVSADRCLAYFWHHMNYESNSGFEKKNGGLLKMQVEMPGSHSMFAAMSFKVPFPGIDNRVFASRWAWRREKTGDFVAGFTPKGLNEAVERVMVQDSRTAGCTRGTFQGFWRFSPTATNVCRATLVFQTKVGGSVPAMAMNWGLKSALSSMEDLRDNYERRGETVDAELRGEFPQPPPRSSLNDEQTRVAQSCLALEVGSDTAEWTPLNTDPFVPIWANYDPPRKDGERRIAIGKAVCDVDCPAKEALAWWFMETGRELTSIKKEQGDLAVLELSRRNAHDYVWVTIKRLPFPLRPRESVGRYMCFEDTNRDLALVCAPCADAVADYGTKISTVRADVRGVARFSPILGERCRLTVTFRVDIVGNVPAVFVNSKISASLGDAKILREKVGRDDEIDNVNRDELAGIIERRQEVYSDVENAVVDRVRDQLGGIPDSSFEKIESPDHLVHMEGFYAGGKNGTPRASTVLDEDICVCAAKAFITTARSKVQEFYNNGGLERDVQTHNDHSFTGQQVRDFKIPTFSPREFVSRVVWRWESETVLLVVTEGCLDGKYPIRPGIVRGSAVTLEKFERLDPVGEIPQTRITWTQQPDMSGLVPSRAVRGTAVSQMMYVSKIRKFFDKSPAINAANNLRVVTMLLNHDESYKEEEEEILRAGVERFDLFRGSNAKVKKAESSDPSVKNEIAFNEGDPLRWGRSETLVRATKEEILAYLWDTTARCRWGPTDMERTVLQSDSAHHFIGYQCKQGKHTGVLNMAPREGVSVGVWMKIEEDTLVLVGNPTEHRDRPILGRRRSSIGQEKEELAPVRAKMPTATSIKEIKPGVCRVVYVNQTDVGGRVPVAVMNRTLLRNLALTTKIREHFLALIGLPDWDKEVGEAVGGVLVTKTDAEKHHRKGETREGARVRAIMENHKGLKELGETYEWVEDLLVRILENKLRLAGKSSTKLCNMTSQQARVIGGGLASGIAGNMTGQAAVDEWILRYPAMGELDQEFIWFRPMIDTIAESHLGSVGWGKKLRLYTGAGLSMLDLITDLYMIYFYATTGQQKTALSLAIMVSVCLGVQIAIVCMDLRKSPRLVVLREILLVLSGVKPGIDAMRVASKIELEHATLESLTSLTIAKGVEIATEAIPGTVLQLAALLRADTIRGQALASVAVSALTTGFTAAMTAFDWDVNPSKRRITPAFYGFVPDSATPRALTFLCMVATSALLLLARGASTALLSTLGPRPVFVYFAGDMGLYFLYRALRGDLWHWVDFEGAASVIETVLARFFCKVVASFTGCLILRLPGEVGGIYFTLDMAVALVTPLVAVQMYLREVPEEDRALDEAAAWAGAGALMGAWFSSFSLLLLLMKPEYRWGFVSLQTGKDYVITRFTENNTDAAKSTIFEYNKKCWREIRDEVRDWCLTNWEHWEDEQPAWFNDKFKRSVDRDMVPADLHSEGVSGPSSSAVWSALQGSGRGARGGAVAPTISPENHQGC